MRAGRPVYFGIYVAVDHHDILPPIMVHIHKQDSPSEVLSVGSQPGTVHEFGERAIAIVVEHIRNIVAEVGFDDVDVAVIVVIGCGDAHSCLFLPVLVQGDTRGNTHFLEGPVLLIVV